MEGESEFSDDNKAVLLHDSEAVRNDPHSAMACTDGSEERMHTEQPNESILLCEEGGRTERHQETILVTPINGAAQQRITDERDILETNVTRESVMYITRKHLKLRKIHINLELRHSLCIASKCIDSRNMIKHLQKIAKKCSSQNVIDNNLSEAKLAEFRQTLEDAVAGYDAEEINKLHGMLEAILLRHDRQYLERVEAKKYEFKKAVRENKPPRAPPTWWQDPTYRFLCLVQGDKTGESANISVEHQRRFASRVAWGLAITFLLIALSFVSVDFYQSRASMAISTKIIQEESLQLPPLYACLSMPQVPSFIGIDRRVHAGPILWGLRSYTNQENGESFIYPQTHEIISDPIYIGADDVCNQSMGYLSKKRIELALNHSSNTPRCYSCLQIGRKRPVWIERSKARERAAGAVTLEFATSKEIDFCYTGRGVWSSFLRDTIKKRLKEQATKLRELGIIVMENPDSVEFALDFGFEAFERLKDEELLVKAQADVICNLYLFSGVFYPVEPNTEVHYSFNMSNGIHAWKMLDDESRYLAVKPALMSSTSKRKVNRTTILNEIRMSADMTETKNPPLSIGMYIVGNDSTRPNSKVFAAQLRENHHDMLLFSGRIEEYVPRYMTKLQMGSQKLFMALSPYRRYNVSLDFASFDIEVSVKVPTTTVAEFLTDVFECIGLFTGVCAYSLLVSPARMYLRCIQNQQQRRRG